MNPRPVTAMLAILAMLPATLYLWAAIGDDPTAAAARAAIWLPLLQALLVALLVPAALVSHTDRNTMLLAPAIVLLGMPLWLIVVLCDGVSLLQVIKFHLLLLGLAGITVVAGRTMLVPGSSVAVELRCAALQLAIASVSLLVWQGLVRSLS